MENLKKSATDVKSVKSNTKNDKKMKDKKLIKSPDVMSVQNFEKTCIHLDMEIQSTIKKSMNLLVEIRLMNDKGIESEAFKDGKIDSKTRKRTNDFSASFINEHLNKVNTHVQEIKAMVADKNKPDCLKQYIVSLNKKILITSKSIYEALQAYLKFLPSVVAQGLPEHLALLLDFAAYLCIAYKEKGGPKSTTEVDIVTAFNIQANNIVTNVNRKPLKGRIKSQPIRPGYKKEPSKSTKPDIKKNINVMGDNIAVQSDKELLESLAALTKIQLAISSGSNDPDLILQANAILSGKRIDPNSIKVPSKNKTATFNNRRKATQSTSKDHKINFAGKSKINTFSSCANDVVVPKILTSHSSNRINSNHFKTSTIIQDQPQSKLDKKNISKEIIDITSCDANLKNMSLTQSKHEQTPNITQASSCGSIPEQFSKILNDESISCLTTLSKAETIPDEIFGNESDQGVFSCTPEFDNPTSKICSNNDLELASETDHSSPKSSDQEVLYSSDFDNILPESSSSKPITDSKTVLSQRDSLFSKDEVTKDYKECKINTDQQEAAVDQLLHEVVGYKVSDIDTPSENTNLEDFHSLESDQSPVMLANTKEGHKKRKQKHVSKTALSNLEAHKTQAIQENIDEPYYRKSNRNLPSNTNDSLPKESYKDNNQGIISRSVNLDKVSSTTKSCTDDQTQNLDRTPLSTKLPRKEKKQKNISKTVQKKLDAYKTNGHDPIEEISDTYKTTTDEHRQESREKSLYNRLCDELSHEIKNRRSKKMTNEKDISETASNILNEKKNKGSLENNTNKNEQEASVEKILLEIIRGQSSYKASDQRILSEDKNKSFFNHQTQSHNQAIASKKLPQNKMNQKHVPDTAPDYLDGYINNTTEETVLENKPEDDHEEPSVDEKLLLELMRGKSPYKSSDQKILSEDKKSFSSHQTQSHNQAIASKKLPQDIRTKKHVPENTPNYLDGFKNNTIEETFNENKPKTDHEEPSVEKLLLELLQTQSSCDNQENVSQRSDFHNISSTSGSSTTYYHQRQNLDRVSIPNKSSHKNNTIEETFDENTLETDYHKPSVEKLLLELFQTQSSYDDLKMFSPKSDIDNIPSTSYHQSRNLDQVSIPNKSSHKKGRQNFFSEIQNEFFALNNLEIVMEQILVDKSPGELSRKSYPELPTFTNNFDEKSRSQSQPLVNAELLQKARKKKLVNKSTITDFYECKCYSKRFLDVPTLDQIIFKIRNELPHKASDEKDYSQISDIDSVSSSKSSTENHQNIINHKSPLDEVYKRSVSNTTSNSSIDRHQLNMDSSGFELAGRKLNDFKTPIALRHQPMTKKNHQVVELVSKEFIEMINNRTSRSVTPEYIINPTEEEQSISPKYSNSFFNGNTNNDEIDSNEESLIKQFIQMKVEEETKKIIKECFGKLIDEKNFTDFAKYQFEGNIFNKNEDHKDSKEKGKSSVNSAKHENSYQEIISVTGVKNAKLICIRDHTPLKEENLTKTQIHNLEIKRVKKPKLVKLKELNEDVVKRVIGYKLLFEKETRLNPMYKKTEGNLTPWDIVEKISTTLMEDALKSIVKEMQLENYLKKIYDKEFVLKK